MGNHRTEKRKISRLQQRINQQVRLLQLQVPLDTIQQLGEHVPPVRTQHEQEVTEAAQAEVNKQAMADKFEDGATHAPTKRVCTGIWVCTNDNSMARSGITIW
jgi:septal ring factor EnvC (AmiA/AmiB activator)